LPAHWEAVRIGESDYYFDGDVIRKMITSTSERYYETQLCERTAENRTIVLPKTARGKPKKLNFTATQSFKGLGVYFSFTAHSVIIANFTTQTTFYYEDLDEEDKDIAVKFKNWLEKWIADTSKADLAEIEAFKNASRQHCKFKEGDFFTFKFGRRKWGFGRILIDIAKRRKSPEFARLRHAGLNNLMGKALIVKVYLTASDTPNTDLDALAAMPALPAQAIMDNCFYYGECKIIGHRPLNLDDLDGVPISFSKSISHADSDYVYLQYGLIYKEASAAKFKKFVRKGEFEPDPYRNEAIGWSLFIGDLKEGPVKQGIEIYDKNDLRNPENIEVKREIFKFFGLDADAGYEENFRLSKKELKI